LLNVAARDQVGLSGVERRHGVSMAKSTTGKIADRTTAPAGPAQVDPGVSAAVAPEAEGLSGERSEPDSPGAKGATAAPSSLQVVMRRRHFTTSYKLRILDEADKADVAPGGIGSLLRREGLYSSHLSEWRAAREKGLLVAGRTPRRGRPPKDALSESERRLTLENTQLRERLRQAELIIDVQKKLSEILANVPEP
jgi:transposase